jgi:hypothetical protein
MVFAIFVVAAILASLEVIARAFFDGFNANLDALAGDIILRGRRRKVATGQHKEVAHRQHESILRNQIRGSPERHDCRHAGEDDRADQCDHQRPTAGGEERNYDVQGGVCGNDFPHPAHDFDERIFERLYLIYVVVVVVDFVANHDRRNRDEWHGLILILRRQQDTGQINRIAAIHVVVVRRDALELGEAAVAEEARREERDPNFVGAEPRRRRLVLTMQLLELTILKRAVEGTFTRRYSMFDVRNGPRLAMPVIFGTLTLNS